MRKCFCLTATIVVIISTLFIGCTKLDVKGSLPRPGIAFTFDDNYLEDWIKMMPLFDSFGVKATFYISNYNKMNRHDKQKLKTLQQHGHEIAYHTLNHYNMNQYLNNGNCNMTSLIEKEVLKGLEKMNSDGFYPTTFAYPYGQHSLALDNELLKYFKSVRALNGTTNFTKSQASTTHNKILYGLGIDESSNRDFDLLLKLVESCQKNHTCLVLVAHRIEKPGFKMHLPMEKLRTLVKQAFYRKLQFYTVSEISN